MQEAGLIQPSISAWNSPVVLVKTKCGSWQFTCDFHKLNRLTKPINQSLPHLESVFESLGGSKPTIFSTLDLNSAYFQIELDDKARERSAFCTHEAVFEWLRMPFGLRNEFPAADESHLPR